MKHIIKEFPGFDHPVTELAKYIRAGDIFTILLTDGSIVHHSIEEQELFEKWLLTNKVENIKQKIAKEPAEKPVMKV